MTTGIRKSLTGLLALLMLVLAALTATAAFADAPLTVGDAPASSDAGNTTVTEEDPAASVPPPKKVKKPNSVPDKRTPARRPSKTTGDGGSDKKSSPNKNSNSQPKGSGDSKRDKADAPDNALDVQTTQIGVPNFFLEKFRIPPFLLPIYEAAGTQYGIRWEILAAINEIETDYGRNLNVSSAGALGWMQFMPATWEMYGVDANNDGKKDPFNPVDAIFAAAKYLKAAGANDDIERAIFAYNHAQWYVDSVMLRARLIAGLPGGLVDSLSGLTRGRFPVYARANYRGAITKKEARKRMKGNAARVVVSTKRQTETKIYSRRGAPVVAVQDATVTKIAESEKLGRYITIQDGYGNRYTYAHLGTVARLYPVPRPKKAGDKGQANEFEATDTGSSPSADAQGNRNLIGPRIHTGPKLASKERLYANPNRALPQRSGAYDQWLASGESLSGYETFKNYFSRPYGLQKEDVVLKPLRKGSQVIGGTILGRIGKGEFGHSPHVAFRVRPAGRGAPLIDPKPILDGWKLLESTAIYRAAGLNPLVPGSTNATIGQVLLMSKLELENYVLSNKDIELYPCGRRDVKAGVIDRRVLALLSYLASSNLKPTISSLSCGHGYLTASGNVSEHSSGNAVDIAAINGISIAGHQEPGGITEQAVRKIMELQGTLQPHQIISLLDLGGATLAMGDHADHIHVGFQPGISVRRGRLRQGRSALKRSDWLHVFDRLGEIKNPRVAVKPSPYSLDAPKRKRSKHND